MLWLSHTAKKEAATFGGGFVFRADRNQPLAEQRWCDWARFRFNPTHFNPTMVRLIDGKKKGR